MLLFALVLCVGTSVLCMDIHGGVPMGVINTLCDDGKTNLTVDWDYTKDDEYFCKGDILNPIQVRSTVRCGHIRLPLHKCMNTAITYSDRIPMSGPHRPLWPVYGEYRYLPPQRWLHSLEHGAIVMLYHPCADENEVQHLRHLVTSCLRRHVITPSRRLSLDQPLALVSYGCRLELSHYDHREAQRFIVNHAKKGGEQVSQDGQYKFGLLHHAAIVCGQDDRNLCLLSRNVEC